MMKKLLPLILCVLLAPLVQYALRLDLVNSHLLDEKDRFIGLTLSFCVTDDEYIMITDIKSADVKIYTAAGSLKTVFGRKGFGPDEFCRPNAAYYNRPFLIIADACTRKAYFYKAAPGGEIKYADQLLLPSASWDFAYGSEGLLVSGYVVSPQDGPYELYLYHKEAAKTGYLLTPDDKYGKKINVESSLFDDIATIGLKGYCDMAAGFAYYAWVGDLVISKVSLNGGKIFKFGKKTANYSPPVVTENMRRARRTTDAALMLKEFQRISLVRDLFVYRGDIGLVYDSPGTGEQKKYFLQLYKKDGIFKKELFLGKWEKAIFFFHKKNESLYVLSRESSSTGESGHRVLKYKIIQ